MRVSACALRSAKSSFVSVRVPEPYSNMELLVVDFTSSRRERIRPSICLSPTAGCCASQAAKWMARLLGRAARSWTGPLRAACKFVRFPPTQWSATERDTILAPLKLPSAELTMGTPRACRSASAWPARSEVRMDMTGSPAPTMSSAIARNADPSLKKRLSAASRAGAMQAASSSRTATPVATSTLNAVASSASSALTFVPRWGRTSASRQHERRCCSARISAAPLATSMSHGENVPLKRESRCKRATTGCSAVRS